jgi:hypothetical protein
MKEYTVYKCGICGGKIDCSVLACNPPKDRYDCRACGTFKVVPRKAKDIVIDMPEPKEHNYEVALTPLSELLPDAKRTLQREYK